MRKGTPSFCLTMKLKKLKEKIKTWANEVEIAEKNHINGVMYQLDLLDKADGDLDLSLIDGERKNTIKLDLANKLNLEAQS